MRKRNWKRVTANSIKEAMRLCIEHARECKNLTVDRIADLMGLSSRDTLYKWLANGRMPVNQVHSFEHICGISLVTQYMAASSHKLLIDMPSGKPAKDTDLIALQTGFNDALNQLARFYQGNADTDETLSALTATLSEIAAHRANVKLAHAPELGLFEEGDE